MRTHLTTFSLSGDELVSLANIQTGIDGRRLTLANMLAHPTNWMTCACSP